MWNIQIKTDENRSRSSKESEKKQPEKQKTINDLYDDFDDTDSLEDVEAHSQKYDECDSSESPWSVLSSPEAVKRRHKKEMLDEISDESDAATGVSGSKNFDSDTNDEDLKIFLQRREEIDRLLYNSTECVSPEESHHSRSRSKSPYSRKGKSRSYSRRSRDRKRRSRTRSSSRSRDRKRRNRSRSGSWSWHSRSRSPVPFKRKTPPLEFFEKAIAASKAARAKSQEQPRKSIDDVCQANSPTKKRPSSTSRADTSKRSSIGASFDTEPITPEKGNVKHKQNANSAEKQGSNSRRTPVTRSASKASKFDKEQTNSSHDSQKKSTNQNQMKKAIDGASASESKVPADNKKVTENVKVTESEKMVKSEAYDPTEPTGEDCIQMSKEGANLVSKGGKPIDVSMHVDETYFEALKKVFQKLDKAECTKGSQQKSNVTQQDQSKVTTGIPSLNKEQDIRFQKLSKDEKLKVVCFFIQYYCKSIGTITLVELALKEFRNDKDMEKEYVVRELTRVQNVIYYCGKLTIGGQFFADAIGCTKREVKIACFAKAIKVCRTCTLEEIKGLVPRTMDDLRDQLKMDLETAAADERNAPINVMKRFLHCVRNTRNASTTIKCKLHNAGRLTKTSQHLSIETEFSLSQSGEKFCIVKCNLAGALLGIAADLKKKQTKEQCLEMVYKRLMLYSAEQLLCGLSSKEMEEGLIKLNSASEETSETLLLQKTKANLNSLIDYIKAHPEETNLISMLVQKTNQLKMAPFCVYKKTKRLNADKIVLISCEMFLNDYLVATGSGTTKNNARNDAFRKAHAFLKSTTGQNIILNQRKLDPEELNFKSVLSYDKPDETSKKENNLKKLGSDPCDGDLSELVIMETALWKKNRYANAFEILNYSCVQNKFLMEWEYTQHGSNYMFHIYIQGKKLSSPDITAPTRLRVKALCSADVLYRLYKTNPVLEIVKEYDTDGSFTNTDIEQQAKVMQMSGMECQELTEDMLNDIPSKMDKKCVKWIYAVMKNMLSIFDNEDTLEEITFGPKCEYYFLFKYFKKKYDIRYSIVKGKEGEFYHVVTPIHTPSAMIRILTNNNGISGRYKIVDKNTLPKREDLNEEKTLALKAVSHTDSSMVEKYKKETVELKKDVAKELERVIVSSAVPTSSHLVQAYPLQSNFSTASSAPYVPPYSTPAYNQPYVAVPVVSHYTPTPIGSNYPSLPGQYPQAPVSITPGYYNQAPIMTPSPSVVQFPQATTPAAPNYQVPPYSVPNIPTTYRNEAPQHTPAMYTNMTAQSQFSKSRTQNDKKTTTYSSNAKTPSDKRSRNYSPRKEQPSNTGRVDSKVSERRDKSYSKKPVSPRKRRHDDSPKMRGECSRRSRSPRRRSRSPRRRSVSPRRRSVSPRRRSVSPRRRSISPRRRAGSPRRSVSPRRRTGSPRRSVSPRTRSGSFRKRSGSPRRRAGSPRRPVTPRRSITPRRSGSPRIDTSKRTRREPPLSNFSPNRSGSTSRKSGIHHGRDVDIFPRTLKEGDLRHNLNNRLSESGSPSRQMNDLSVSLNRIGDKRNVITTHKDSPAIFDEGPDLIYDQLSPERFDERLSRDLNNIRSEQYFYPKENPGIYGKPMHRYDRFSSRDLEDVSPERFDEPSRQLEAISPERMEFNDREPSARFDQIVDDRFHMPDRIANRSPREINDHQRRSPREINDHQRRLPPYNEPPRFEQPPRFDNPPRFEGSPRRYGERSRYLETPEFNPRSEKFGRTESAQMMDQERMSRLDRERNQRFNEEMRPIGPNMGDMNMWLHSDRPVRFDHQTQIGNAEMSGTHVNPRPHESASFKNHDVYFPGRGGPFSNRESTRSRSGSVDRNFRNVFPHNQQGSPPGFRERSPNMRTRSPPGYEHRDRFRGTSQRGRETPKNFRQRPGRY